jgi:hypothetical protein
MSNEFWFARRFPVGNRSNAVAPVTKEGRLVGLAFVASMLVGAAIGAVVGLGGNLILGIATFAVIAGAGGFAFIYIAQKKTDRNHTVADYQAGIPAAKAAAAQRKGGRRA